MDCAKVGRLILQLRREKGLTQKQVADALNISNKTVSKWECGMGCPDASLWTGLSMVLGADIYKLLEGDLIPNKPDVGKLDKIRFYVCSACGNILTSTGEASIACCGRKLYPLLPTPLQLEHRVSIKEMDGDYYFVMQHTMRKDHYISFMACVFQDKLLLNRLYPEQSPETRFPILTNRGSFYIYCTKDGLQRCALQVND